MSLKLSSGFKPDFTVGLRRSFALLCNLWFIFCFISGL
jgi:hypothetical protein